MGGTTSKTTREELYDITTKALSKVTQKCFSSASNEQIMKVENVKGDVNITDTSFHQYAVIDMTCLLNTLKDTNVQQQLASTVIQDAESKGIGLVSALGNTKAEAISALHSKFQQNTQVITESNVQNIITNKQKMEVVNIEGNVTISRSKFKQTSDISMRAVIDNTEMSTTLTDIATSSDQKSKSTEENAFEQILRGWSKVFGSLTLPIVVASIVCVLILLYIMFF